MPEGMAKTLGKRVARIEDPELVRGRARFVDDIHIDCMLHAVFVRSPHAHAKIRTIDAAAARRATGVAAVIIGAEVTAISASLVVGVKAPIECWPIAVDRVRYVGEPVAVVLAASRYLAEDALELVNVGYEPLPPVLERILSWRLPVSSVTSTSITPINCML